MGDVNAALGIVHLKYLDAGNQRRAGLAAHYDQLLARVPGIRLIAHPADRQSSHYLYVLHAERRDQLAAHLRSRGITTTVHYKPSHLYPIFEPCELPGAEAFYARALALPLFPQLKEEDVETVAAAIKEGW
jgi:dTDP-4-amino-4,6-dideoxygalactose transaminase